MSSAFGKNIRVSLFGQSHSKAIGVVIDGLPAGFDVDMERVYRFMKRRAPGRNAHSTTRKEEDRPEILSGIVGGRTCGAPVSAVIANRDTRSKDYEELRKIPRPGHADFTGYIKYGTAHDIRGGGHFSGRLTAPLCFAGAICEQILEREGIHIGAHIYSIRKSEDTPFDPVNPNGFIGSNTGSAGDCNSGGSGGIVSGSDGSFDVAGPSELHLFKKIKQKDFPVIDDKKGQAMLEEIETAKRNLDSLGGIIECAVTGLPAGLGSPMFGGVENRLAQVLFGIPAVKGVEFGAGFQAAAMTGSQCNDPFYIEEGTGAVKTETNNHGGILGGITSGMPLLFKVAIKPTPSIGREQRSVDLQEGENALLKIEGRHDPCIVPRGVPCLEAAAAAVLLDMLMDLR